MVAASSPAAFGYGGKIQVFDDVKLYFNDARPILDGKLPYRDYPVEYPVLAIPLFLAPLVAGSDFEAYKLAFVAEMLLFNAGAVWLVARRGRGIRGDREGPGAARLAIRWCSRSSAR